MEILISGNSGFLGKVLHTFLRKGNNVKGLSRSNSEYNIDLAYNSFSLDKYFDLVIHVAGKVHQVKFDKTESNEFFYINVHGTYNLLKALESNQLPKSLIFISSVAVYGLKEGNQINEDSPLLAKDPYGLSKIRAEALVQEWCKKHEVICTILRLPLVVGSNPPGNLGAMIKGIQKGYYFNIDGGKARKSMVLAEDIAKNILKAGEVGGIYNLTDGYHPNFEELSQLIAKQLGKDKVLNMPYLPAKIAAKIGDLAGKFAPLSTEKLNKITSTLTFDDSKARAVFGWNPTPILDGFKIN